MVFDYSTRLCIFFVRIQSIFVFFLLKNHLKQNYVLKTIISISIAKTWSVNMKSSLQALHPEVVNRARDRANNSS